MQLQVKGKNLEVTDAIRSHVERKLRKLERRLRPDARVEVELAVEKNPSIAESQVAEATLHVKGRTLRARESARDMKGAIDELADKLVRQVNDIHDKRVDGRKHGDARREDPGASGAGGPGPEPETVDPVEAGITES